MDPKAVRYTREHEWAGLEGGLVTMGISNHAQGQLGDVVYVELPRAGSQVERGQAFGGLESVKAFSDLYSPVTGEVAEVNEELVDHPEWVNQEPYGKGWLIKVKPADPAELDELLTAEDYEGYLGTLEG